MYTSDLSAGVTEFVRNVCNTLVSPNRAFGFVMTMQLLYLFLYTWKVNVGLLSV